MRGISVLISTRIADKFSRLKQLKLGNFIIGISLCLFGYLITFDTNSILSAIMISILFVIAIATDILVIGNTWTISLEMLPNEFKSVGTSTAFAAWALTYGTSEYIITLASNGPNTFFILGSLAITTSIYATLFIPETFNKTFSEIKENLKLYTIQCCYSPIKIEESFKQVNSSVYVIDCQPDEFIISQNFDNIEEKIGYVSSNNITIGSVSSNESDQLIDQNC